MASFVFVGDPNMEGKDLTPSCTLLGMTFPAGESVEVIDEDAAARLRRHNHFKEVDAEPVGEPNAVDVRNGVIVFTSPKRRGRPPKVKDEA